MAAFCEILAANGLASATVGDVVRRAAVSRAAFYQCFDDLSGCGDAAYDRYISVLLERLATDLDPTSHWHAFIEAAARAYLGTLQSDRVVSRAMQLEMDAAGKQARVRRRRALQSIADVIRSKHLQLQQEDETVGPLPDEAYTGYVYGVRQLACDLLELDDGRDLMILVDPVVQWIGAGVSGAAIVRAEPTGATAR